MSKNQKSKKRIVFTLIILLLAFAGFTYRYLTLNFKTVAKIDTSKDDDMSINQLYLTYQLRMSQYTIQKKYNLSTTSVDKNFWQQLEDGKTRQAHLNEFLLDSTKAQLVALDYAKENNIILDREDLDKVQELKTSHSSKEEINFITEGVEYDERIFGKIFENLVLSEKAIKIGAKKENLNNSVDNESVKVTLAEEIVINIDNPNNQDNLEAKKQLAEKIYKLAKDGNSLEELSSKYQLGYKNNIKLSKHDINDDDINKHSIEAVTKLKKDEISEVIPIYNSNQSPNDTKAFVIFRCINDNIQVDTENNANEAKQSKSEELFRKSLKEKINNTNFQIDEKLFNNLK